MKKTTLAFFIILSMVSCSQWQVNEIKFKELAKIKNGNEPGDVEILRDDYSLNELTFSVHVLNDRIITTDNSLKRIQVLDKAGKPELIIGNISNTDKAKIPVAEFNFSVLGSCTVDDDDSIYVQNRIVGKSGKKKNYGNSDFLPSYILVFNKSGQLQYTLGKTGIPDIPFFYIENLFVDSKNRLFVISKTFNTWELYRFKNKTRERYIDFSKIKFKEEEGNKVFKGKIENMKVFSSGESVLISVAYYHGLRFKYRKIYEYSMEKGSIIRTIATIPDPKNVLFNIVDDKIIYFWNVDNGDVKFMIVNMEGNVMSNVRINFDNRNFFSKIIHDNEGNIYSYHADGKFIKILEWE